MSQMPQSPRDRINYLVAASRDYEAKANQIQYQIGYLNQKIAEMRIAGETIEGLGQIQQGQEILLPLGNLAYIKAIVTDTSKVILNIGAGVNLEKPIEAAKENIDKQLEDLSKLQMQLKQALQQVLQQMQGIQVEIEKIATQIQQGKQQPPMMGS